MKGMARKAVCTPASQSRLVSKIFYKVVNGKLLLQEFELLHTHPRSNAAVADFALEFARLVYKH